MARIAGVDLPREKRVEVALTYIYGVGRPTSNRLLSDSGINPDTRVRDLSDTEVARLRQLIDPLLAMVPTIVITASDVSAEDRAPLHAEGWLEKPFRFDTLLEVARLRQLIERSVKVEGALRTEIAMNIKRLMDIGSYRGSRHRKGLPVRGQRTHTNARTKRGPRRAIAGKKKATKK